MTTEDKYLLSVIIPVYNTEPYLEECVASVLAQTLGPIQIVLIDDCSPDNAGALCDQLAQDHSNILVLHKENGGLGLARNSGLELATGKYIAFLDSDDYLENRYYENLVGMAEKYSADVCYVGGLTTHSETAEQKLYYTTIEKNVLFTAEEIKPLIPRLICGRPGMDDTIPSSANLCVYNRQFFMQNHLRFISERIFASEDMWFQIDCLNCASRIVFTEEAGYVYRYNAGSLSRKYDPGRFEKLKKNMIMLEQKCADLGLTDYEDRIAVHFWGVFEKCINQIVRFEKNQYRGVKAMSEDPVSQQYLTQLSNHNQFTGLHALLCRLLKHKMYGTTILCLKLYNILVHGE